MRRLYEIYNPDLDAKVRFKILTIEEAEAIINEYADEQKELFARAVLENVVANLQGEVKFALRKLSKEKAKSVLNTIYTGCLMLNPALDVDSWVQIANAPQLVSQNANELKKQIRKPKRITRAKFLNLERHLKENVIGQDEAIEELVNALKRSQVGLGDDTRPLAVFLFGGSSGVGKSLCAKVLHEYLFGNEADLVRIDCGEYQHKHENLNLFGTADCYFGFEEGGILTNAVSKNPQTVILLDEVEKAHPDIWDTFLKVFDEGLLTDGHGNVVSFRDTIIIMTTNLGNDSTVKEMTNVVGFGNKDSKALPVRSMVVNNTMKSINKAFKPELLNRLDRIIVFNHLTHDDYVRIAEIELQRIQTKLEKRGFILTFDDKTLQAMVRDGVNHVQGARGLSQLRRDRIENPLADLLLAGRFKRGTAFSVTHDANDYQVTSQRPVTTSADQEKSAPIETVSSA